MNKTIERARKRGRMPTKAWTPKIDIPAFSSIEIDGKNHEVTRIYIQLPNLEASVKKRWISEYRVYDVENYGIIASLDRSKHGYLLHLSVSHAEHLPPWEIMIGLKRLFFPDDVAAVMLLPEEEVYINVHEHTLHIWQLPEKWGIE